MPIAANTVHSNPIRNSHQPIAAPIAAVAPASPRKSGHRLCGDQQHQQPRHGIRRQRMGRPPASLPGVGELADDKRQGNQHGQDGSGPSEQARRHQMTLREPDPGQSGDRPAPGSRIPGSNR